MVGKISINSDGGDGERQGLNS